jgi:hypothetical protein
VLLSFASGNTLDKDNACSVASLHIVNKSVSDSFSNAGSKLAGILSRSIMASNTTECGTFIRLDICSLSLVDKSILHYGTDIT